MKIPSEAEAKRILETWEAGTGQLMYTIPQDSRDEVIAVLAKAFEAGARWGRSEERRRLTHDVPLIRIHTDLLQGDDQ